MPSKFRKYYGVRVLRLCAQLKPIRCPFIGKLAQHLGISTFSISHVYFRSDLEPVGSVSPQLNGNGNQEHITLTRVPLNHSVSLMCPAPYPNIRLNFQPYTSYSFCIALLKSLLAASVQGLPLVMIHAQLKFSSLTALLCSVPLRLSQCLSIGKLDSLLGFRQFFYSLIILPLSWP